MLLKRLRKLESQLKTSRVSGRHSEEYRTYWSRQWERALAGEDVDLSGLTREFVDEVMDDFRAEVAASGRTEHEVLEEYRQTREASGRKGYWSDQDSYLTPGPPS